jgi:hypothetical protein
MRRRLNRDRKLTLSFDSQRCGPDPRHIIGALLSRDPDTILFIGSHPEMEEHVRMCGHGVEVVPAGSPIRESTEAELVHGPYVYEGDELDGTSWPLYANTPAHVEARINYQLSMWIKRGSLEWAQERMKAVMEEYKEFGAMDTAAQEQLDSMLKTAFSAKQEEAPAA